MATSHNNATNKFISVMLRPVLFALVLLCFIGVSGKPAAGWISQAHAADSIISQEYQIKAAFLYNFAKFIEWPADAQDKPDSPFVIGIYGPDPFGDDIDQLLRDESIHNKRIIVRRFKTVKAIDFCNILFINVEDPQKLDAVIEALKGRNVLTVGQSENFTKKGGMTRFFIEDDKVRFEINKKAADRSGLHISSQLLKLARVVNE